MNGSIGAIPVNINDNGFDIIRLHKFTPKSGLDWRI